MIGTATIADALATCGGL